jgi:CBS domain-containing protein
MKLPLANKGQSRLSLVSELMTPAGSIVTAKPSHTVLQCVSMMRKHKVRNLPVMDKQEEVQAVLGMQDVSRQIFNTFKKGDAEAAAITIGDLLDDRGVQTPGLSASLPHTASVADAIGRMRELSSGSLLVTGDDAKRFGLFTERDFLYNVVLYDEKSPAETPLHEVSRFTVGTSKATMAQISSSPALGDGHRPEHVTCVERKTRVIDCLSLMLGSGLLYVPVTENKQPINIISMRDINLFLSSNV